jgi:hypothetical protein
MIVAAKTTTRGLLDELDAIDHREDHILDVLLRHGQRLEEAERLSRAVTVGDLRALETALAETQGRIARALADVSGSSASNGATPATFDALAASLRAQDAESDRLRTLLRERLLALQDPAGGGADRHAANPGGERPRTFRVTRQRMHGADVKAFQSLLNRRFAAWGVHKRIAESGIYDAGTRHAARQVARGLGVAPVDYVHGITPALRTLIRMPSRRTPRQLERARAQRGRLRRLREHHRRHAPAPLHHAGAAKPVTPARPGTRDAALAAAIRAHGGRYEQIIVREARRSKLPVALVCAMVEQESSFRNVFGHDKVANPIKSPVGGTLAVTHERYLGYLHHRRLNQGCQGVGPMQLTDASLQDAADALGGCWRPGPNIREGCAHVAGMIRAHGKQAGIQGYNPGAGQPYVDSVLKHERAWHVRLAGVHAAAGPKVPSGGPNGAPRTFRLTSPPLSGQDVKAFQHVLNGRFDAWGVHMQIAENGMFTAETRKAARQVARGLGIAAADYAHGITPAVQRVIRRPKGRTPRQLALARQHRDWLRRLRKHHAGRGGALRLRAHAEARKLIGVMETGGKNRGKVVLEIIKANAGKPGEEWCGDFLAYCYRKAGSRSVTRNWAGVRLYLPMTGLKRTKTPLKGDIARYTKLDHIGMFVCWCDARGTEVAKAHATHITTIEGNTTSLGAVSHSSTGGQGVYKKLRPRSVVSEFIHVLR